jgi:nitrile hydratase
MTGHDSDEAARLHRYLHAHLPPDPALRVKALESLVVERGMVAPKTLDAWVEAYSERIGPKRGAQVVAHAWSDPDFKARLMGNGSSAIA